MTTDDERFERCFAEHYPAIAAYLLRRCASREDAEDAATEVFATAWRRLRDVPAPPEDRLWLFGVARRVLANQRRAERRRDRLWHRLRDDAEAAGGSAAAAAVADDRVGRALHTLCEGDRELLLLTAWEGLEVREIARVLGVPAPIVSRRLHRARRRLRHVLDTTAAGDAAGTGHASGDLTPVPERTR